MVSIQSGTTLPWSVCSWHFIRPSVFVIWCTTRFSSWSFGFSNVFPSSWDHCEVIWGYISLVCWLHTVVYITGSCQWVKLFHFLEEFRTLYCWYSEIWMTQNLINLIDNKTNIIYLTSTHCVKSLKSPAVKKGASSIIENVSGWIRDYVRNLLSHSPTYWSYLVLIIWVLYDYKLADILCMCTICSKYVCVNHIT